MANLTLIDTIVLMKDGWELKDVSKYAVDDFLKTYEAFMMEVSLDDSTTIYQLESSEALRKKLDAIFKAEINITVEDAIAKLTDSEVTLSNDVVRLSNVDSVYTEQLWDYPGKIVRGNTAFLDSSKVPEGIDTDIVYTTDRPLGDVHHPHNIHNNCLIAINGFIRKTELIGDQLFIVGAADELSATKGCAITVINFSKMGGVKIIPITEDNLKVKLRTISEDKEYVSECRFDAGVDLANKKMLVVKAGTIRLTDSSDLKFAGGEVNLTINHRREIRRILNKPFANRKHYLKSMIYQETAVDLLNFDPSYYLTRGDSFIIVLEDEDIFFKKTPIYSMGIPGVYHCHRKPNGIIGFHDGRVMSYYGTPDKPGRYTIRTNMLKYVEYLEAEDSDGVTLITHAVDPQVPSTPLKAELMDIYRLPK